MPKQPTKSEGSVLHQMGDQNVEAPNGGAIEGDQNTQAGSSLLAQEASMDPNLSGPLAGGDPTESGAGLETEMILGVMALESGISRLLHGGKKGLCDGEEGQRLAKFLVRLVHEKTLPPSSVMELARPCRHGSAASSVLAIVREEISQGRGGQSGGSLGGRGLRRATRVSERDHVGHARRSLLELVMHYLEDGNKDRAAVSLIELNAPYLHYEVVKRGLSRDITLTSTLILGRETWP